MTETRLKAKDAPELAAFAWDDAFLLEDQLGEDERMVRDAARAFARTYCSPRSWRRIVMKYRIPGSLQKWGRWACSAQRSLRDTADSEPAT